MTTLTRFLPVLCCGALAASASTSSSVDVANFSARAHVAGGENVTILGIVVTGDADAYRPVLFRGSGPWLGQFGVTNPLSNPFLRLYEGQELIAANDDWQTGGNRYAIRASGLEPADATESALVAMLMPGAYTVHLGGGAAGIGLTEAFFIDEKTIPANLIAAGDFTTLVTAVQAAGLVDTLSGAGPFTLFAPTDAAFAALPAGTVDGLLADIPTLTNILLYHVAAGHVDAARVVGANSPLIMANGAPASVVAEGGSVTIDGSTVIEVDWMGSNGVIHVVDKVMLPPPNPAGQTLVQNLAAQGEFSTLVAAVQAAGLVDTLNSAGPFTLFAPTDAAFAKLPAGTVQALLNDIPTLTDILLYHVVSGARVLSSQVADGTVTMANGDAATLSTSGGVSINAANVTGADWLSSNGVIHIIDSVILPPSS